ncbi:MULTISPECIES: cell wall hydrolase [Bacillus]|uniref:cell wall hydrolase n=1 Tax=Bacillus TaxID=1386 RepID=UPI0002F4758F|nr:MULTISPECIES: cell wall hydrolase [Bacillus]
MKKLLFSLVIAAAMLLISLVPAQGLAETTKEASPKNRNAKGEMLHVVKKDENVTDIAIHYGVPLPDLIKKNKIKDQKINEGDVLVLPKTLTSQEKDLMARLVHAEAKGEPYKGKVAVAVVVLNRVDSDKFPNTVTKVINAKGQFSPVANGSIKKPASAESKKAVNEAIALQHKGTKATFFYNPDKTNDKWIKSLPVLAKIGNHTFATS